MLAPLSPPAMRARGPLMRQLSPGGPKARRGCRPRVYFLAEKLPRASPGSLAGIYLGRKKKKKGGFLSSFFTLVHSDEHGSFHHFFGIASAQCRRDKIGLSPRLDPLFPSVQWSPVACVPCLESIFSPNRFYSSFKVICQIIFPIYIVNESNPTNSF